MMHFIIRWSALCDEPITERTYQHLGVILAKAKDAFEDELCFNKKYHKNATQFLQKVETILISYNKND